MRRVVVTGIGIVSSIGNDRWEVLESLRQGRSGLEYAPDYQEMGLRSHVRGPLRVDLAAQIDRKVLRFMGDAAAFNYMALREAIADAKLSDEVVSNPRTGLITGSGGGSPQNIVDAADLLRNKGLKRVGPYMVPRTMSSTTTACLATPFKIKGVNYSLSSACATSAHCIGHGGELIQWGKQDVVFAGGGEELHWSLTHLFDAMGALSTKYNATPQTASRPYDIQSRRLRDLRWRRHRGAGGTGARPTAWRADLRRADRIRRHLRRSRHGAALWRGRAALHATGAGGSEPTGGLYQHPWHQHAGRRHARTGGDP